MLDGVTEVPPFSSRENSGHYHEAFRSTIRNDGNQSNYTSGSSRVRRASSRCSTSTMSAQAGRSRPGRSKTIRARGDERVSHGYHWIHHFKMDEDNEHALIRTAVTSIEQSTDTRPFGGLSRYVPIDNMRRMRIAARFAYHMDDFSADMRCVDTPTLSGKATALVSYQLDRNDIKMGTDPACTPANEHEIAKVVLS